MNKEVFHVNDIIPAKYFHRPDRTAYQPDESLTRKWINDKKHKLKQIHRRQTALQKSDKYLGMEDDELDSHDKKRLSARKPLKPQPLKIASRYFDFNQAQAKKTGDWSTDKDGVNRSLQRAKKIYTYHQRKMKKNEEARLSRRAKGRTERKQEVYYTLLKGTLLDSLIKQRITTQQIFITKFHTARFVNGKKIMKDT